jgi:hypothetical protein
VDVRCNTMTKMSARSFVITAAVAIGSVFFLVTSPVVPTAEASLEEWETHIRAVGPQRAYNDFASSIAERSAPEQHGFAHVFGGALFQAVGTRGLATCDSRFAFGCFHEFLGRAIRDLGLDVVNELNAGCKDALPHTFLSCQHGIGHGVQAHFGYDESHLLQALDVCQTLPDADVIGGCYGGVFMEYNLRTMWGISAIARPLGDGVQYPCTIVESVYIPACLYWQPQWWSSALVRSVPDHEARIVQMGKYCVASKDRNNCFEGMGNIMLSESRDNRGVPSVERTQQLCAAAARAKADELRCLSVAANHFGVDVSVEEGKRVCGKLSDDARVYCEQHAINKANIAHPITFPNI